MTVQTMMFNLGAPSVNCPPLDRSQACRLPLLRHHQDLQHPQQALPALPNTPGLLLHPLWRAFSPVKPLSVVPLSRQRDLSNLDGLPRQFVISGRLRLNHPLR